MSFVGAHLGAFNTGSAGSGITPNSPGPLSYSPGGEAGGFSDSSTGAEDSPALNFFAVVDCGSAVAVDTVALAYTSSDTQNDLTPPPPYAPGYTGNRRSPDGFVYAYASDDGNTFSYAGGVGAFYTGGATSSSLSVSGTHRYWAVFFTIAQDETTADAAALTLSSVTLSHTSTTIYATTTGGGSPPPPATLKRTYSFVL